MPSLSPPSVPLSLLEGAPDLARDHLRTHYRRLSGRSRRLRFLHETTPAAMDRIAEEARPDLIIEALEDGAPRGVLEAYATSPGHAEIAFSVEDDYQGHGLGHALLNEGLRALGERGFETADLHCLRENSAVLHLVRSAGGRIRFEDGEAVMAIDLSRGRESRGGAGSSGDRAVSQ